MTNTTIKQSEANVKQMLEGKENDKILTQILEVEFKKARKKLNPTAEDIIKELEGGAQ